MSIWNHGSLKTYCNLFSFTAVKFKKTLPNSIQNAVESAFSVAVYKCVYVYARTTWHHNISEAHGWFNVLLKRWFDKLVVLFDDTFKVSSPLCNISPQPTHQPDVRVCVHKNLHVQQLMGDMIQRKKCSLQQETKIKDMENGESNVKKYFKILYFI